MLVTSLLHRPNKVMDLGREPKTTTWLKQHNTYIHSKYLSLYSIYSQCCSHPLPKKLLFITYENHYRKPKPIKNKELQSPVPMNTFKTLFCQLKLKERSGYGVIQMVKTQRIKGFFRESMFSSNFRNCTDRVSPAWILKHELNKNNQRDMPKYMLESP